MKFFTTLLALPLLGAVFASPIPAKEDKRLLGLDLGLGGVVDTLDLQGLLDGLTKDLQPPIDALLVDLGLDDVATVQGELDTIKGLIESVDTILEDVEAGDVSGALDEVSAQVAGVLTTVQETIDGLPTALLDVPAVGGVAAEIQPLLQSLVTLLDGLLPGVLTTVEGLLGGVTGTVGGLLDGLLGGL